VPIAVNRACAAPARTSTWRAASARASRAALKGFFLSRVQAGFPGVGEPRTGKSMGEHCEMMAKEWQHRLAAQDQLRSSRTQGRAAYERGSFTDLGGAVPRPRSATTSCAPDTTLEKLGNAQARVRQTLRQRHAHRRQFHPADRRRAGGAAVSEGVGAPRTAR
jgi:acetyl-CoA C-acetyltransferase